MQSFFLDFLFFFLGYIYLLSPLVSFSSLDYIDFLTCHRVFSGHLDTVSLFFYQRAFSVIGTGFFFFFFLSSLLPCQLALAFAACSIFRFWAIVLLFTCHFLLSYLMRECFLYPWSISRSLYLNCSDT